MGQRQQQQVAEAEADRRERPGPFPADAVGEMADRDMPEDAGESDQAERPGRDLGGETDLDQVAGLVHLHRVPGEQHGEEAEEQPPEARGADRAAERPVDRRPVGIDDVVAEGVAARPAGGVRRVAVRLQAQVLRPAALQQEVERHQHDHDQDRQVAAGVAPAGQVDLVLDPGEQQDRADADAGEGDADGETAAALEPERQEHRMADIAHEDAAADHQQADGGVEMPGLGDECGEVEAGGDQHRAERDHQARAITIDQGADQRRVEHRGEEADGEGRRGGAARPAELVQDRRVEQRKRGPRIDRDAHRDEGHGDHHPAVEERQAAGEFRGTRRHRNGYAVSRRCRPRRRRRGCSGR